VSRLSWRVWNEYVYQASGGKLAPWSRALLKKPPVDWLLKNLSAFYRTRRFIVVFTTAQNWSPSWPRYIQSITSHPIRSILVLSSKLHLGLHSGLFPSGFPLLPLHTKCPAYVILPDLIIPILCGEEHKLQSQSLCSILQPPIISFFFGPNILLSILFSNTLNLCSSFNVLYQFSHPYESRGKIIVSCILILTFLDRIRKDNRFWNE
jgi:hypothetical protein